MSATPRFTVKWAGECAWCGEEIVPGDEGSYDLDDRVCHLVCRELQAV
jgi:hypothetical protein